ncbi:MAG: rhodanese-like domain-containing protein [Gammaproteobacteria bacterium]|jgi:rhodanese-related sulfurtransferase|nr:rhodanese-like domain-containing protein [Gammaproteobacteria bacterium]MBT7306654.1 rhodanese-like domain-containing protein [Gammaproteobacteria bacterium]
MSKQLARHFMLGAGLWLFLQPGVGAEKVVAITQGLGEVRVLHGQEWIVLERNQDTENRIDDDYARTSRPCPPFCIQPMEVTPEVESIGELELLDFMRYQVNPGSGVMVDARTPDWYVKGTIPGSINVPYSDLDTQLGADDFSIEFSLEQFGATKKEAGWDFFQAKTLLLWCNGPWCGQSPTAIRALLALGYPAEKLKYYRGGMQMWQLMGFPVALPADSR